MRLASFVRIRWKNWFCSMHNSFRVDWQPDAVGMLLVPCECETRLLAGFPLLWPVFFLGLSVPLTRGQSVQCANFNADCI